MKNGRFARCPRCPNIRDGAKVYECNKCRHRFCEDCCRSGILDRWCPNCGHAKSVALYTGWRGLGFIKPLQVRMSGIAVRYRR
jgi:hypothetical protein